MLVVEAQESNLQGRISKILNRYLQVPPKGRRHIKDVYFVMSPSV